MSASTPENNSKTQKNDRINAVTARDFAGLLAALIAVTLAASILLNFSSKQESAYSLLSHTHDVFHNSQDLLLSSAKADMCVRNFLLTRHTRYLSQYKETRLALAHELTVLAIAIKSPTGQTMLRQQLTPALSKFVTASDALLKNESPAPSDLDQQETAKNALLAEISTMQQRQLKLISERSDHLAAISESVAQARFFTFFVAIAAVILSLFTWRMVMKKDKLKIASLEKEIENTHAAEQKAYDALAIADKSNQLKTEFIANVSHEIRTPMTGILGSAELLSGMNLDEAATPLVKLLLNNSRQLLGVLNDLLNFSKLQRKEIVVNAEPFAVKQLVEEVAAGASDALKARAINLTCKIENEVPPILLADEEKVRQILQSFLSNAAKFTNEGCVEINVDVTGSGVVRFAVLDTGIGIKPDEIKNLFQPFVQIDGGIRRSVGGTGIGLFLARQYVEVMAGEIGVSSEPGMGSIFWFTLQAAASTGKIADIRKNRMQEKAELEAKLNLSAPKAS